MKRELFTVEGNTWQKKAFVEQLEAEGFTKTSIDFSNYLTSSDIRTKGITSQRATAAKHFILPHDWDAAIEAFSDYYKEEELIVGRWYSGPDKDLIKYLKEDDKGIHYSVAYFYLGTGWVENDFINAHGVDELIPATKEEIQTALENEAKKRGFKPGAKIKETLHADSDYVIHTPESFFVYDMEGDYMYYGGVIIYFNGKWAELLPSTPDITINGYKAEFKGDRVSFNDGCAVFHKSVFEHAKLFIDFVKGGEINNREVTSITIGKGTFTVSQIEEINNYFTSQENGKSN